MQDESLQEAPIKWLFFFFLAGCPSHYHELERFGLGLFINKLLVPHNLITRTLTLIITLPISLSSQVLICLCFGVSFFQPHSWHWNEPMLQGCGCCCCFLQVYFVSYCLASDNLWSSFWPIEPSLQDCWPLHFFKRMPPTFRFKKKTNLEQTSGTTPWKLTLHSVRSSFCAVTIGTLWP